MLRLGCRTRHHFREGQESSGWGGPNPASVGDIFTATGAGSNTGNLAYPQLLGNLNTISSDEALAQHTPTTVDLDTVTFFLLNQREAALGSELNNLPEVEVSDADAYYGLEDGQKSILSNPIGSIPVNIQITPQPVVTAGNFAIGRQYSILSLGDTEWVGAGLAEGQAAEINMEFTATAAGSGDGTARDITPVNVSTITADLLGPKPSYLIFSKFD